MAETPGVHGLLTPVEDTEAFYYPGLSQLQVTSTPIHPSFGTFTISVTGTAPSSRRRGGMTGT